MNFSGYGFVRFGDEDEMRRAKYEMQGSKGLGLKAIRCSIANPKGYINTTFLSICLNL